MPYLEVYIGRLSGSDDPLDWGGDPSIGNTPPRIGPLFPPNLGKSFRCLVGKIKDGQLSGKQVDWGAWAATVSKREILTFVEETYRGDRSYSDPDYMPHLFPQMRLLLDFVHSLPDDGRFALVATEL